MIGYVMDADVDADVEAAVSAIEAQLGKHRKVLLLPVPKLRLSSLVPGNKSIRETVHHRKRTVFYIHHLFLA